MKLIEVLDGEYNTTKDNIKAIKLVQIHMVFSSKIKIMLKRRAPAQTAHLGESQ